MDLLVGLGNPGRKYNKTRHNIGFVIVDELAKNFGEKLDKKKFKGEYLVRPLFERKICMVKPLAYMNLSGDVVRDYMRYFDALATDLMVVHDDIDLPFGKLRVSFASGHGGHNGIRSIIDSLKTKDFYRLRVGVGRPPDFMEASDYVLSKFNRDERSKLTDIVGEAMSALDVYYKEGADIAMQKFNV